MNKIKTFEKFEFDENFINDVKDLFYSEVEYFEKYQVELVELKGEYNIVIQLSDYSDFDGFDISELKDLLIRMKDFLGKRFIKSTVSIVGEVDRMDLEINEKEIDELSKWYNKVDAPGVRDIYIKYKNDEQH